MASPAATSSSQLKQQDDGVGHKNNNTTPNGNSNECWWSISVKTVGAEQVRNTCGSDCHSNNTTLSSSNSDSNSNNNSESSNSSIIPTQFQVVVKPSDDIYSLYDSIERVTGLTHHQQRLIYRGRILPSSRGGRSKKKPNQGEKILNSSSAEDGEEPQQQQQPYQQQQKQQRLASAETTTCTKLSEIQGLGDGQTIHLVRRQGVLPSSEDPDAEGEESPIASTSSTSSNIRTEQQHQQHEQPAVTGVSNSSSGVSIRRQRSGGEDTGGNTGSLLAALLGLSVLEEETSSSSSEGTATTTTNTPNNNNGSSPSALGSWRRAGGARSRSRQQYRLTAQDLVVEDPGPLESVRQGLLTLHTLLEAATSPPTSASSTTATNVNTTRQLHSSPLDAPRRWYIGQWIDCRDTVNQWLEATIVGLARPDEIFPDISYNNGYDSANNSAAAAPPRPPTIHPAMDPAVGASDLEGRRRLLLEPCDHGDPDDMGGDLEGYKRRPNDQDVVLLLIHYNGWPHRWDEWIRSDSERLRPFRTRTRHDTATVQPVVQTPFADAPSTRFTEHEAGDRAVVLHELLRVMTTVQALTEQAARALPLAQTAQLLPQHHQQNSAAGHRADLPWTLAASAAANTSHGNAVSKEDEATIGVAVPSEQNFPPEGGDGQPQETNGSTATERCKIEDTFPCPHSTTSALSPETRLCGGGLPSPNHSLRMLAPLLDRLGRTLVEVAPHVSALAVAAAESQAATPQPAEHVGAPQDDDDNEDHHHNHYYYNSNNDDEDDDETNVGDSLGGLLSLLTRDRRRNSQTSPTTNLIINGEPTTIDPDYTDFATGLVNTSRGEIRAGPRRSGIQSSRDDIGGLLAAYLAAASLSGLTGGGDNDREGLGRLLRTGGGGPGIDIHIHAVMTTPMTGGLALAAAAPPPVDLFADTRRAAAQRVRATLLEQVNEEDTGIFDDLYSENPDPVSTTSHSSYGHGDTAQATTPHPDGLSFSQHQHTASTSFTGRRSQRRNNSTNNVRNGAPSSLWGRLFRRQNSS